MNRILAVILAFLMLPLCAGCNNEAKESIVESPTEFEMGKNTIAYAGGYEITRDDINTYVYLLVPYIQQYTGASEGWENIILSEGLTARDILINMAIEQYRDQMAFVDYVKEKGLYSDSDAEESLALLVENMGGEAFFNEILEAYGLNIDAFKRYAGYNAAYMALMEDACTDEAAAEIYNKDYITAKHILVLFEGRDSEEAAYNEAIALYERAVSGESFEKLIDEHGEDPGQDSSMGYTFAEGTMVDEFYKGALNLKEGEISEPVKTTYGYHIIKRISNPGSNSAIYANTIATIKSNEASNLITEEVYQDIIAPYPLTINESILSSIDLSIYTMDEVLDENVNYADGSVFNE